MMPVLALLDGIVNAYKNKITFALFAVAPVFEVEKPFYHGYIGIGEDFKNMLFDGEVHANSVQQKDTFVVERMLFGTHIAIFKSIFKHFALAGC